MAFGKTCPEETRASQPSIPNAKKTARQSEPFKFL